MKEVLNLLVLLPAGEITVSNKIEGILNEHWYTFLRDGEILRLIFISWKIIFNLHQNIFGILFFILKRFTNLRKI